MLLLQYRQQIIGHLDLVKTQTYTNTILDKNIVVAAKIEKQHGSSPKKFMN